jgi:hypothetical protein
MLWIEPLADGVYVTEQELVKVKLLPSLTSEQLALGVKAPAPELVKATEPAGSDLPPAAVSVTVAVQTVPWLTTTLAGTQLTLVLVDRRVTVSPKVSSLPAWMAEPP